MSSSLLLQQCPACLVRLTWMVWEMKDKWPYSSSFVGCCFQDLFNIARSILVQFPISFPCVLSVSMWCICTVVLTQLLLGRNSVFIYRIDQTFIWLTAYRYQSTPSLGAYWHHFQWMRRCYRGMWTWILTSENYNLV